MAGDQTTVKTESGNQTDSDARNIVVVDLGKRGSKQIKNLRKGRGKLMDQVTSLVDDLKENGTVSSDANTVVLVVERRVQTDNQSDTNQNQNQSNMPWRTNWGF